MYCQYNEARMIKRLEGNMNKEEPLPVGLFLFGKFRLQII